MYSALRLSMQMSMTFQRSFRLLVADRALQPSSTSGEWRSSWRRAGVSRRRESAFRSGKVA